MQKISYETPEEFLTAPRFKQAPRDRYLHIKVNRLLLATFVLSVLLHIILLIAKWPDLLPEQSGSMKKGPLQISLVSKKAEPKPEIVPPPVIQKPKQPAKVKPKKKIKPKPKVMAKKSQPEPPVFTVPEAIAQVPKPAPDVLPQKEEPLLLEVPKPNIQTDEAPTDMMAMIRQKRAKRIAQGDASEINAAAIQEQTGPSEAEKREARIKENLKGGTNGVFQVTSLYAREATFVFRGWTGDYSNARTQYFQVFANSDQNIRLEVIRRMIKLIRSHYQGDFSWQSHRLGRSITLSARLADNAGLEDFLMDEIFGDNQNR